MDGLELLCSWPRYLELTEAGQWAGGVQVL